MPRTTLRLQTTTKGSEANEKRMWMPLLLDNFDYPQTAVDRQAVLDVIRSVYDPLLIVWLGGPGHTWANQFSGRTAGREFQTQILARMAELPAGVQSVETRPVLGGILYDILRYYRFTDAAWRAPLPGAAAAPPPPPPPPPAAAAPAPVVGLAGDDELAAANMEVLIEAAVEVLSPAPVPAANILTPLQILAEVASSAEPSPIVSPTSSLDILAAAASILPYAPMPAPAPTPAPAPVGSPAPGDKRGRDDSPEDESEQPAKKKQAGSG
ncbi:unnamed protein product [Penicillium glandicola]